MADNIDDGLGYGHLGDALYNPDQKRWNFQRPLESVLRVEALGPPQTIIPSAALHKFTHEQTSAALRNESADILCKDAPEIAPSRSLLPSLARLSSSVIETTSIHDPLIGPLFAIGSTRDELLNARVPVAIFVSDTSRRRLTLAKLESQKQGWADSKDSFLRVPQLSGDRGEWLAPAPVAQVLGTGAAGHADGVFAVRSARGTYLLHIRLARAAVGRSADERASRFVVAVRGFIPLDGDRASLHADVAMNPWAPMELAVIDVAGRWQVHARHMQIHHVGANDLTCMASNRINFDMGDFDSEIKTQHDGWMKITWICDRETLLMCSRTSISIANLRSDSCRFVELESGANRKDVWFLDIRLDPYHLDRCFLLTRTFVYHVRISRGGSMEKKSDGAARMNTLAKLRHCRDSTDPSLKLSLSSFDSGTLVMISSSSSALSTLILFNDGSGSDLLSTTISSMAILTDHDAAARSPTQDTVLLPATWDQYPVTGIVHDLAEEYRQRGVSFWTTFSLHRGSEITQRLIAICTDEAPDETIQAPQWKHKPKLTPARLPDKAFVVDDDEVDLDEGDDREATTLTEILQRRRLRRSFELEKLYQKLVDVRFDPDDEVAAVLSKVMGGLRSDDNFQTLSKLLIDFANPNLQVGDLGEAVDAFDDLRQAFDSNSATNEHTLVPIAEPALLHVFSSDGNLDIRSIYTAITSNYLYPLSLDVPDRVRLAREQLARRTAARLVLSSCRISAIPSEPESPSSQYLTSAMARLSTLTPISLLPSVPKNLSSSATGILAHWTPATDPQDYDFKTTRLRLQRQREERDDPALAERRRRKRLKLARRSAGADMPLRDTGSSQALFSSQVQSGWASSQAQPGWGSSQVLPGSSQMQTQGMVMGSSQTLPGSSQTQMPSQSQGVPVRKKGKVKKRTQGF